MKKIVAAAGLGVVVLSAAGLAQDTKKAAPPAGAAGGLTDLRSQASYGMGLSLGRNLKANTIDIDIELLARGIRDGLSGAKPALTDEQIGQAIQAFEQQVRNQQMAAAKSAGEKNLKDGQAFLAQNKAKPGIVTLPSGLQYKVVKDGAGAVPKATDVVRTHYRGTLLDGTEFDSSYKRNQPASFPVNGVIAGWTEALQKMKVGSRWQLFIPANLAYGENPPPGAPIGPNSVLVFDIELLDIEKPAAPGGQPARPGAPR